MRTPVALIVVHALLSVAAFTSWLWLDYRIIAILAVAHLGVLALFKGCPLSHARFPNDQSKRFYEWWMGKIGIAITVANRKKLNLFMKYGVPLLIVLLALTVQTFGLRPLLAIG